uniref:Carboxypeptidase n=1 Tax=Gadus morhua TaxID=8049 RepID=A0A8C5BNF9_GADMO
MAKSFYPCAIRLLNTGRRPSPGKEAWGYVDVREGAHMFWWLYYADGPASYQDLPLVLWLQGGPGGSSTGFGNFEEIGPLDRELQPRKTSWTASVLFVDNPVGTGFSYVDGPDGFSRDVATVASDMLVLLRSFFTQRSELQNVPFYIFSESYGGKMAAAISVELSKVLLNSCLYRVNSGPTIRRLLSSLWHKVTVVQSLLDDYGLLEVTEAAEAVRKAVEEQSFQKATELWSVAESVVDQNTNGVNFYNILTKEPDEELSSLAKGDFIALLARRHIRPLHRQSLVQLMNGEIRDKLGLIPHNVTWGGQAEEVFSSMAGDFMRPVVALVDQLLAAGVNVSVYNGQLDLIVDTMGQERWVNSLAWEGLPTYKGLRWTPLDDPAAPGTTGAFYKRYRNFSFYWILRAGHMIPSDQGAMALQMLKMVTQQS